MSLGATLEWSTADVRAVARLVAFIRLARRLARGGRFRSDQPIAEYGDATRGALASVRGRDRHLTVSVAIIDVGWTTQITVYVPAGSGGTWYVLDATP